VGNLQQRANPSSLWKSPDRSVISAFRLIYRARLQLYAPDESAPRLLPEVLTPAIVLAELSRLPAAKSGTAITQR
jgi:hypothetical protein